MEPPQKLKFEEVEKMDTMNGSGSASWEEMLNVVMKILSNSLDQVFFKWKIMCENNHIEMQFPSLALNSAFAS